ncbi:MAG: emp24/gp25L/p24 family protein [Gemmataceae bacterium]|nr:emp24/gp25L/p24 family protein [Gemmataceae bacterium]
MGARQGGVLAIGVVIAGWAWAATGAAQTKDKPRPDKPFTIEELGKKVFHLSFRDGEPARLEIRSTDDTDVDLYVEELDGTEVGRDIDPSKDCKIVFEPTKGKVYRVSVINLGPGSNSCRFTHNGKEENVDFGPVVTLKPVKIAEDGKHALTAKLAEGKWAAVWVTSEQATDVDLHVFDPDGNEIARDEHVSKDAFVSFLPKVAGEYRIVVTNLGGGENTCTIKHSTLDAPKEKSKK